MANPYYEMFSDFGDRLNRSVREGQRMQAFAGGMPTRPDGSIDYGAMATTFLRLGDTASALAVGRLAESQAENARTEQARREAAEYRRQTLERLQAAEERQGRQFQQSEQRQAEQFRQDLDLRRQTAAARGYDIVMVKQPDGSERPVRVNRATGEYLDDPSGAGGGPGTPLNPYATGKFNEGQGKAALFADRIAQSEDLLEGPYDPALGKRDSSKGVAEAGLDPQDTYAAKVPVIGNYLISDKYRQFEQAERNFINATLRRESGAVINPDEFVNARKQYIPQPNDDEQTLLNKAANRRVVFEGLAREAGPAYRPPPGYLGPNQYRQPEPGAGAPPAPGAQVPGFTLPLANVGPSAPQQTRGLGPGGPPPAVAPGGMGNDPRIGAAFAARAPGGAPMQNANAPDLARMQAMGDALAARGIPRELIVERLRQAFGVQAPGPAGPPPRVPPVPAGMGGGLPPAGPPQGAGPVAARSIVPVPQMGAPASPQAAQMPMPQPVPPMGQFPPVIGQPVPPWLPQPPKPVPQMQPTGPLPPPQPWY